ncbi:hypothetical protein [Sandaracinus amylolyticus]|uniref:Uncharacterized protein n=1 Tax=Sandaracinus amylolyticus TaxID=927083 RepID=A0A0F6SDG6_9BACT|nr:hypothetical protein [Sandaracinus amylolyticus]AKF03409.1 hypothetical protein DB32_000558 [Sandaracinus amylolyticus]
MWYPAYEFRYCAYEYIVGESFQLLELERRQRVDTGAPRYERVDRYEAQRVLETAAHRLRDELRHLVGTTTHYTTVTRYSDLDVLRIVLGEVGSIAGRIALLRRLHPRLVAVATPKARLREVEPEPEPEPLWLELELLDEAGEPIADARYEVELPGGDVRSGSLDSSGRARIEGLSSRRDGIVRFPDLETEYSVGPER